MKRKAKVSLIGTGGYGRGLLRQSRLTQNLEMVNAYYYRPEKVEQISKEIGIPVTADFDQILNDPEINGLVIVTPNDRHLEQAAAGIAHGKAIFVDKPIANTVAEGVEMIQLAEKAGVPLMVGHNLRRLGTIRICQQIINAGRLGDVVGCEGHFSRPGAFELKEGSWRAAERCPTGPLIQLGIHVIDMMIYLLGPVAEVGSFMDKWWKPGLNIDNTVSVLHFVQGAMGYIGSNYLSPWYIRLLLLGTKGMLETDGLTTTLFAADGKKEIVYLTTHNFSEEMGKTQVEQLEEFGRVILEGEKPETDGPGALQALAVVNAAQKSAEERRVVTIREFIEGNQLSPR